MQPAKPRARVVHMDNVQRKTLDEIVPGDITADGVVLYKDRTSFMTSAGVHVPVDLDEHTAIFGRVDRDVLEAISKAVEVRRRG